MNALVVYESMFGNTAQVGEAIADSLRSHGLEVWSGPVAAVEGPRLEAADLLVVGAPTHAHGMSSKATRKAAVEDKRYPADRPRDTDPGMRDWLQALPPGGGRPAVAFDTRFDRPRWLTGSAAKGIAGRLEQHGFRPLAPPESFYVNGEHRLEPEQLERAAVWGATIAELASAAAPS